MPNLTPGLERLRNLIVQATRMNVNHVAALVEEAAISEEDLLPYAAYEHAREDGYGRQMVYQGKHFEIMVMSWLPGDYSAVHDHGHTTWGAVQVFGHVMHQTFAVRKGVFALSKKEILPYGSVVKVNNPLIHQMGNITSGPYLTLHIYGNDTYEGEVTADARIFELETGLIKHTTGGAFFNLPDHQVYDVEEMPEIDPETLIHQAAILLQYYQRYDKEKQTDLSRKLINRLSL